MANRPTDIVVMGLGGGGGGARVGFGGEGGTGGPPRRFIRPSRAGLLFRPPNAMAGLGVDRGGGESLVAEMIYLLGRNRY